ncbi:MAG: flagellar basal body-associated FliL family protein [Rhodanobacter sp.]|nr:MAG: flagellar basal body-associated FliL family protein [Rhodanobacter sp.]
MVEDEEEVEAVEAPVPRKRRLPLLIGLAIALLALGGGAWMAFRPSTAGGGTVAKSKDTKPTETKAELYLSLQPAFVVNLRGSDSVRYLQVGITLMSHDSAAIEVAKEADPVIRNALVLLLGSQDSASISDTAGRQKLQEQALTAVQKIVQARLGRPGIKALYFTSFVMQ